MSAPGEKLSVRGEKPGTRTIHFPDGTHMVVSATPARDLAAARNNLKLGTTPLPWTDQVKAMQAGEKPPFTK
jgi:hypothetical protein